MFRKLTYALVMVALVATEAAAANYHIDWDRNLERAWKAAQLQQRPLLLFVTGDQCRYCTLMKQQTWRHPAVASAVNQGFVAAEVRTNFNDRVAELLKIRSLPTTFVISPDRKVLARLDGYLPPGQLIQQLEELPLETVPISHPAP